VRYLLIDRVLEFERGRRVVATKNVTLESDVMEHHFRGFPLFPGALTLESMTQAAAYLIIRSKQEATGELVAAALATVERAHFRRPARPGDQLRVTVRWTGDAMNAVKVTARADIDGANAARARLLLTYRKTDAALRAEVEPFVTQLFRSLERREGPF
jgi:3-hydroxyacyl-[acyl-carrier-protein] dehydratase